MTKAILENNEISALGVIDEVINDGKDIYNFVLEVIKYIKDILVYKSTNKLNLYSENEIIEIKELSEKTSKQRLLNIIYKLSELENSIKTAMQKTIILQAGIINICSNQTNGDISELEHKIAMLEQKINNIGSIPKQETVNKPVNNSTRNVLKNPEVKLDNGNSNQIWNQIIENLKKSGKIRLYTSLVNTKLNPLNDQTWEIQFPNGLTDFNKKILDDIDNKNDLIKTIALVTGNQMNIRLKDTKNTPKSSNNNMFDGLGIDINIID